MKLHLFATIAVAACVISAPGLAQQNAGTAPDSVGSNSNSNSSSSANQALINGGSSANNGGVTVGPDTATSNSTSGAISGSVSDSHSTGGSSTATGGNASTGASSAAANNAATNAGNAQSLTVNNVAPDSVRTVPTVYAPGLTTTLTETCMGSTSAGGSWLGAGFTLGTTWEDSSCKRRLDARELAQTLGDREAARAVLCGEPDIADAYERLGRPCPKSPNYKSELAGQYIPQLPTPAAPPTPVVVNVQSSPPPLPPTHTVTMQPIPNP